MLDNFPSYIQTAIAPTFTNILNELRELRHYKSKGRPPYSAELIRYALYLRYTSRQAYIILQEQFPLPSLSFLRKLHNGGIDHFKAMKCLLNEGKMSSDVALLFDEIYIQRECSYQNGEVVGNDEDGNLYSGVMVFMIVGLDILSILLFIPVIQLEWECIETCGQIRIVEGFFLLITSRCLFNHIVPKLIFRDHPL